MGLFNTLAGIIKHEKAEEKKLLIDVEQAIGCVKGALRRYKWYMLWGFGSEPYEMSGNILEKWDIKPRETAAKLSEAVVWLREAKVRIAVIERLAQRIEARGYNQYRKVNMSDEERDFLNRITVLRESLSDIFSHLDSHTVDDDGRTFTLELPPSLEKDLVGLKEQKQNVKRLIVLHQKLLQEQSKA